MESKKEQTTLGGFLLEYRKSRALTQQQFAEKIGMTRCRYSLIENDKIPIGPATISAIAAATKKSASFIAALARNKQRTKQ